MNLSDQHTGDVGVSTTSLGERVRSLLKAKGWSQAELSRRSQITPAVLSRVLSGERPAKTDHDMSHKCHAHGCARQVPPRMFVCLQHWKALPGSLKRAIYREYVPGQERTKTPTLRYMAVQRLAVGMLAFKPNDEEAARVAAPYLLASEIWRRHAIDAGDGDPLLGLPGAKATPLSAEEAAGVAAVLGARA